MRHPFAGIIVPENTDTTRRAALKTLLAGAASAVATTSWVSPLMPSVAAAVPDAKGADEHRAYLVIPSDFRSFRTERRKELGVLGDYYRGDQASKKMKGRGGFLAWASAESARRLAAAEDVADVIAIDADHKPTPEKRPPAATALQVHVIPGGWETTPPAGSFTATRDLVAAWSKRYSYAGKVTLDKDAGDGIVMFDIGKGDPPRAMVRSLVGHPQVVAIAWMYPPPTRALGEDGGATTEALGEEGGGPTTLRVGEEGGPSTRALGEEGGVTTKALGEEGGTPTTLRVGEEGGTPTTLRLGEEGGKPTTLRVGEEGGVSTQALGEEGGR